jgi:hypothetical protein
VTDETKKIAGQIYERLYDDSDDLVVPPEPSPMASPCSEYCPSFDDITSTETLNQELVQRNEHCHRPIPNRLIIRHKDVSNSKI